MPWTRRSAKADPQVALGDRGQESETGEAKPRTCEPQNGTPHPLAGIEKASRLGLAFSNSRAGDRTRTDDNHVGNVMLYQLSYTRSDAVLYASNGRWQAGSRPAPRRLIFETESLDQPLPSGWIGLKSPPTLRIRIRRFGRRSTAFGMLFDASLPHSIRSDLQAESLGRAHTRTGWAVDCPAMPTRPKAALANRGNWPISRRPVPAAAAARRPNRSRPRDRLPAKH